MILAWRLLHKMTGNTCVRTFVRHKHTMMLSFGIIVVIVGIIRLKRSLLL